MQQHEGFIIEGQEDMVCKLKKSIYGLKQALRQWYLKFDETITKFGFKENIVDPLCHIPSLHGGCVDQAAIFFSKHDRISKGSKHMDLKYLSLKQDVRREKFIIEHNGTELMVADIFTKALPPKTFMKHAESMGLEDIRVTKVVCLCFTYFDNMSS